MKVWLCPLDGIVSVRTVRGRNGAVSWRSPLLYFRWYQSVLGRYAGNVRMVLNHKKLMRA